MISNSLLAQTLPKELEDQGVLLIPETGIQFIDLPIVLPEKQRRFRFSYNDSGTNPEDDANPASRNHVMQILRQCSGSGEGFETFDGQRANDAHIFNIDEHTIIESTHSAWFPLPYLRMLKGHKKLDNGPYNWVRGFITPLEEPGPDGENYRLTLAIDTTTDDSDTVYNSPSKKNVYDSADIFQFAFGDPAMGNFLDNEWVQIWSKNTCRVSGRLKKPEILADVEDEKYHKHFEDNFHFALYCGLLQFLDGSLSLPGIRFLNTSQEKGDTSPIDVDFVLDVGNSRTCGILFEHSDPISLSNCYSFKLRDLNAPAYIHDGPFSSRMEFVDHAFGDEFASAKALGNKAFVWPSIVRLGPEAERLAGQVFGNEGDMGLTSPKRYIWDRRPNEDIWYLNPNGMPKMATDSSDLKQASEGDFMGEFAENGEPLSDENPMPMVVPHFSRSSLMTFFLAELFLQAWHQINAAHVRYNRANFNRPRRIRRIVLTVPTAMTVEERLIFEQRAHAAKEILWKVLKIKEDDGIAVEVKTQWDEAVATQAVFLYNETITNFKGRLKDYFQHFGRNRKTPQKPIEDHQREAPLLKTGQERQSLRIASIDIGGGTTDLIITTYYLRDRDQIVPHQNFREGFNVAGDDIVGDLIEKLILPKMANAFDEVGHPEPLNLIGQLTAPDREGMQIREKTMRRQFTALILQPVAYELIDAYERAGIEGLHETMSLVIGDIVQLEPEVKKELNDYVNNKNKNIGAPQDMDLFDTKLFVTIADIDATVRKTIDVVIHNLAEVIYAHDCDFLLLTGRPSRMPAIRDLLLRSLPIDTNRLLNMHQYVVGNWYPYRDVNRRLDDPKTTVSVGAMVCALSQLNLEGFFMYADLLTMRSTARHIGYMSQDYTIKKEDVLFENVDLDDEDLGGINPEKEIEFASENMLAFRQMKPERWQATPYYYLYYDKAAAKKKEEKLVPPYKVTLRLRKPDKKHPNALDIEMAEDSRGISVMDVIKIRLQTVPNFGRNANLHWIDVGAFDIEEITNAHRFYAERSDLDN